MKKLQNYISGVVTELRKVTWPTGPELKESTITVIIFSGIMAGYVFVADFILGSVVQFFLGMGS